VNVLVVDDSAVVRQVLGAILSHEPDMQVSVASDPLIAMDKMRQQRPDVIVLDLEMPRMDGFTFLSKIMAEDPIPVLVCSSLVGQGPQAGIRALALGAVDVVAKPQLGLRDFLHDSALRLVTAVRGASQARLRRRDPPSSLAPPAQPRRASPGARRARRPDEETLRLVAVGASTGGPEVLRTLLSALPIDVPPLVVVQHMPEKFTRSFAQHLDQACAIDVVEAEDGAPLESGCALIAPGNRHMQIERNGSGYRARVSDGALVRHHRPSVDVLFQSVAETAGADAVGLILTGMGDDGARGLLAMKQAGAVTLAQDEASCVVYGMPREAVAMGAVDDIVAADHLSEALLALLRAPRR
jgi:two-component system chemotaxis response regulator CheB